MTFLESTNPVVTVDGDAPISSTGGPTPLISIEDATTDQKGAVQLEDSHTSTSTTKAATPNSVKEAYDHTTTVSGILKTDIDTKSDLGHIHDDRYYTETEIDDIITTISGNLDDHNELNNLDYASAGHTGFQPAGDYATTSNLTSVSGALQTNIDGKSDDDHIHDDRYYTESEVDTISGSLQANIDSKSGTLLELSDTPSVYDANKYLRSTVDGTEWSTVESSAVNTFLDLTDTPTTYSGHIGDYLKVASDGLRLEYTDLQACTATTTISGWSSYNETTYYADFEHNLNTDEIAIFIVDTTTNKEIGVENVEVINVNTVRIYVVDDTYSIKVSIVTGGCVDIDHTHDDRYYTETELDNGQLDNRYYTESEVDTISGSLQTNIDGKSDIAHLHDDRYYTESEVDDLITTISGKLDDHNELNNLDYASAGHTGFQPAGDYVTNAELNVVSGTLQTSIDNMPVTLLDLEDTPTTYSGAVGKYLQVTTSGIDFVAHFSTDNVVYVAKNGSDTTERGSIANPFLTIQAGIDYAYNTWSPLSSSNPVVVKVAPGIYEEQIHSYDAITIVGYVDGFDAMSGNLPVTIYNTGADTAHYPLRSNGDENYIMLGVTVKTDVDGVVGKIPNGNFQSCRFIDGYFIERDNTNYVLFSNCAFSGSTYGGFYFTGTNLTGNRNIELINFCEVEDSKTPTLLSTHTGVADFKCASINVIGSLTIGGDWRWRSTKCYVYNKAQRNIFDTTGGIYILDTVLVNGIHFTSAPLEFYLVGSSFEGIANNEIPNGEADITADVTISGAEIRNTITHNGFDGEIQIVNPTKNVGYGLVDSYRNITEALKSSVAGEVVQVYAGTYNENINIPAGVDLVGSSKEHTIVTSSSGTAITKTANTVSHIKKFTFISTASGTNDVHIATSTAGSIEFIDCTLKVDLTDMYTEAVVMTNSDLILNNTDLIYVQTGTTTGSGVLHRCAYFDGNSSLVWKSGSLTSMTINDGNDLASATLCETTPVSNTTITMNNSTADFLSQYPLWGGNAYAMRVNGSVSAPVDCSELTVTVIGSGGAGDGYVFYFDTSDGNGTLYGSLNVLTATGFAKNYIGYVGTGDTFNSHFDMLNAVDLLYGYGTVNFVTSPGPGNLQLSGYLFNPYSHVIEVAKTGAQFTSVKEAIDSIIDPGVFNRYVITVGPGIFAEDNPIQLKPWVSIKSIAAKEVTMISAQNASSDLFTGCDRSFLSSLVLTGVSSGSAISLSEPGVMLTENLILVDCEHCIYINHADAYVEAHNLLAQTFIGTIGEVVTVISGTAQVRGVTVIGDSEVETIIKSDAGNVSVFNLWSESQNVTNGLYVDNGGELFSFSGKIEYATNGMRIGQNSLLDASGMSVDHSTAYDLLIEDSSGRFIGSSCSLNRDKLSIVNGAIARSFGYDRYTDKTRVLGNFSVGNEDIGAVSQFGEGGSYEHAVKVKTYDGSDYNTLTTQSGISFPNTTSGTCIYIGSDHKFYGLKYTLASGIDMGSGSVAYEYYDANGSWVAFNKMNTIEDYSDIVDVFTGIGETYTLRFDQNIKTGIYESDVTASGIALTSVDGVNGYWIRHRIVDNITSSQEVTSLRLKGSYFVARSNGTRSFHGSARVEEIKDLIIGATSAGTADEALSVSSNILFPYTQNRMATTGADEAVYSRFIIPSDCDLSCGLLYTYEVTNVDSPSSDKVVHLTVTMAGINGDDKFDGTATEYVVDDFTFTILATDIAWTIRRRVSVNRFDLSLFCPGNVIYCKLHRPNNGPDTYASSVCLANHYIEYRSWQDGISNKYS